MSEKKYLSVITATGAERIAAAAVNGKKVGFSQMAVGDGAGVLPVPDENQAGLVNECFRTQLNSLNVVDNDKNIIAAEMIIPPHVGGFMVREAALFDDDGACLAVANVPETYKPLLAEGSGRVTVIRIFLAVSSTGNIELITDPGIVLATVEDVIASGSEAKDYSDEELSKHARSRNHPDATLAEKGFTQLSNATDSEDQTKAATPAAIKAAIAAAIRGAWELDNPVGTTRFFNQNLNPNERWPWSVWVYTGENRTIRIALADGSNVGKSGGSDTVTLQRANLPAVQINVSGETSELPEATLTSKPAGKHKHGGVPSRDNPWEIGGDISQRFNPANLGETDEAPDHEHAFVIPPHKHTTTGKTDNLGEGKSFSVVEAHTLLMCWARVA
ncbi:phage tail protein [Klebsiella grimontii]|uniref:phage tail protein n=1 Tax=Klebsiella grimontii TaxID=2058152 RepID=UPI0015EA1ABF|nr:phage tail protein [Klebsiella grimontii]QLU79652.1 phage tail protein [Klebsiella grimontii]